MCWLDKIFQEREYLKLFFSSQDNLPTCVLPTYRSDVILTSCEAEFLLSGESEAYISHNAKNNLSLSPSEKQKV